MPRRSVRVFVTHSKDCKDRGKGSKWQTCNCFKRLLVYDPINRKPPLNPQYKQETGCTSWADAEKKAQEIRESWDPILAENKRLKAEKERKKVTLQSAVALYIQDQITQHGDNGTVAMVRSLFGSVTPEGAVERDGRFWKWLKTLPISQRPIFISDVTPTHLTQWRASWDFTGTTPRQRWGMVKSFFSFCEGQDWITASPCRKLKGLKGDTERAIFSDDQYVQILDNVWAYHPENIPEATKKNWQKRLEVFFELCRWTGMDLIDAVKLSPDEQIDAKGVLTYHRQKTGVQAIIPLEPHLQTLLRHIPLERDFITPKQPFRSTTAEIDSDVRRWQHRLENLFKLAKVMKVRTDKGGWKKPNAKMLRHTFAVGQLRNGVPLPTVSMMLGHTSTKTTEDHYLPFVPELRQHHIDTVRKIQKQKQEEQAKKQRGRKVLPIGSRS